MAAVEHVDETIARVRDAAEQGQARAAYELLRGRPGAIGPPALLLSVHG